MKINLRKTLTLCKLIVFLAIFSGQQAYAQCTHYIKLTDTYGDGWNGNRVSVSVNGSTVLTNITLNSGYGPATFAFSAPTGATIRVWRSVTGSYVNETRTQIMNVSNIKLYDQNGTLISSGLTADLSPQYSANVNFGAVSYGPDKLINYTQNYNQNYDENYNPQYAQTSIPSGDATTPNQKINNNNLLVIVTSLRYYGISGSTCFSWCNSVFSLLISISLRFSWHLLLFKWLYI
jgi:hypothetical protein